MSALRRVGYDPSFTLSNLCWTSHRSVHAAASKPMTNRGSRATRSRPLAPDTPPSTGKTLSQLTQELDISQRRPAKRARKPAVNIDDGHAPRNKLIAYLAHIESTKDKVTLEDIEQYKHRRRPNPRSSTYDQDYTELLDVLAASFTIPQLKRFLQLYGTRPPPKRRLTKRLYAETIMEKWGWTSLAEVQQDRIDQSEVSEHQFPMEPGPSFLLMGKDGADLLSLAKRYNVHLSFTSNPLTLKVQGLKGSLKQVEGYLDIFKSGLEFETSCLPLGQRVNPEASQSISRASGAYVEAEADGKLWITYRKSQPHTAQIAKRLAVQTSMMDTDASTKAIFLPEEALDILSSSNHSLYPFLPMQTSSRKLESRSAFRLRRVGHWITDDSSTDAFTKGLAHNSGTVAAQSSRIDIRSHLLGELAKVPFEASFLSITASSGHFLFLAPTSRPTSLVPPLAGIQEPNVILDWIKKSPDDTFFNPSVPQSLLSSGNRHERQFHRLVYVAQSLEKHRSDPIPESTNLRKILTVEIPEGQTGGDIEAMPNELDAQRAAVCQQSMETGIDILIPDSPSDIHIWATNSRELSPNDLPEELRAFTERLRTQPSIEQADIPLMLTYKDTPYILRSSDHVRQRRQSVPLDTSKDAPIFFRGEFLLETTVDAVTGKDVTISKVTLTIVPAYHVAKHF
ncbi:unnamed protein product [Cyclocybe aegerita]|uniref:Uncharacterized protein n=1 Tax=Cyclocybe aegerita TaxID=1973307 RepID=A0A8S0X455_CYCAE|nr:unnamed protein product [Cyclocybe aegerita]